MKIIKKLLLIFYLLFFFRASAQNIMQEILESEEEFSINSTSFGYYNTYGTENYLFSDSLIIAKKIKSITQVYDFYNKLNSSKGIRQISKYSPNGLLTSYERKPLRFLGKFNKYYFQVKYDSAGNPIEIRQPNRLITDRRIITDSGILSIIILKDLVGRYKKYPRLRTFLIKESLNFRTVTYFEKGEPYYNYYKITNDSGFAIFPFEDNRIHDTSHTRKMICYFTYNSDSTIKQRKIEGYDMTGFYGFLVPANYTQWFDKNRKIIKQEIEGKFLFIYDKKGRIIELKKQDNPADASFSYLIYSLQYGEDSLLPLIKKYRDKECKYYYEFYK